MLRPSATRPLSRCVGADEEAADAESALAVDGELPELGPEVRGTLQLTDGELVHAIRHAPSG